MELKELLLYAKRWLWFILLLSVGFGVSAYYLYPFLPITPNEQRWGASGDLELPRDNYRVVSGGDTVTKRVVLDPNTEIANINSNKTAEAAAKYFALLEQKAEKLAGATTSSDRGAKTSPALLQNEEYRRFADALDARAAIASDHDEASFQVPGEVSLEGRDERVRALREQFRGLATKFEQVNNSRRVTVSIENARNGIEAMMWVDAVLLAAKRESHRRLIEDFDTIVKEKTGQLAEQSKRPNAARYAELAEYAKKRVAAYQDLAARRMEAQILAEAGDPNAKAAPIESQPEVNDPVFNREFETEERRYYYATIRELINLNFPSVAANALLGGRTNDSVQLRESTLALSAEYRRAAQDKTLSESSKALAIADGVRLTEEKDKLAAYTGLAEAYILPAHVNETERLRDARRELVTLFSQKAAEGIRSQPAHPAMIELDRRIDAAREQLRSAHANAIETAIAGAGAAARAAGERVKEAETRLVTVSAERNADAKNAYVESSLIGVYIAVNEGENKVIGGLDALRNAITLVRKQRGEQSPVLTLANFSATAALTRGAQATQMQVALVVAIITLIGSSVGVYVYLLARNKISNEYDVRRHINLPVLAKFPRRAMSETRLLDVNPKSGVSQAFSTLATLVRSYAKELSLRSLLVTSAIKEEGKTDIASNLSIALSRKGLRVLLVDVDLHRSRVGDFFGEDDKVKGLIQYLAAGAKGELAGYVIPIKDGPDLLLPGGHVDEPVRLLESDGFKAVMKQAEREYDFVVFDTPPVARVGDALIIASDVDATILVASCGDVTFADAALSKRLLTNVQANLLGVVLNNSADVSAREYYNYYSYGGDQNRRRVRRVLK